MSQGMVIKGKTTAGETVEIKVTPDGTLLSGAPDYKILVDDTTTPNVTYVAYALPDTATSASVWQIQRIDTTSGVVVTWADGDTEFDNVYDDRESLSYS